MAGGGPEPVYTGMKYYFNSETQRGRLNWVYATFGSVFVIYQLVKFRSNKKAKLAALPPPEKK